MVPEAGIEPARPYERGILSPKKNSRKIRLSGQNMGRNFSKTASLWARACNRLKIIAAQISYHKSLIHFLLHLENERRIKYAD
jgi:hypothetical protein